jgi:hypothetical protein
MMFFAYPIFVFIQCLEKGSGHNFIILALFCCTISTAKITGKNIFEIILLINCAPFPIGKIHLGAHESLELGDETPLLFFRTLVRQAGRSACV